MTFEMDRRDFLKSSGALIVSAGAGRRAHQRVPRPRCCADCPECLMGEPEPGVARRLARGGEKRRRHGVERQGRSRPGACHRARADRRGGAGRKRGPGHRIDGRHDHHLQPGRRERLDRCAIGRQPAAQCGGRSPAPYRGSRGGEAGSAGRQPGHRERDRRGDGRRREARVLRRTGRRQAVRREGGVEQADREPDERDRAGETEARLGIQGRRPIGAAQGHSGEDPGHRGLPHQREGAGHAAWPDDSPGGVGRGAGEGRRGIDRLDPRRARGAKGCLPRSGRPDRMGRDQSRARAEGRLVGGDAQTSPGTTACSTIIRKGTPVASNGSNCVLRQEGGQRRADARSAEELRRA